MACILIIDSDRAARTATATYLEYAGFRTLAAATGGESLDAVSASEIDVIVLDIVRPAEEGLEILAELRRRVPGLPVIVTCGIGKRAGEPGVDVLAIAAERGATATFRKPFGPQELLGAINRCLEGALQAGRRLRVLLVEDNPADADLMREALEDSRLPLDLLLAMDGLDALDLLLSSREQDRPPDLILLDLNLPRKNGQQVLAEIRADRELRMTPVIVLTSSTAEHDVARSYELGANCYVVKPVDFRSFRTTMRAIEDFWLSLVRLPPRHSGS